MSLADDLEPWQDDWDIYEDGLEILGDYLKGTLMWKTKGGKGVNVKNMEESHIRNILRLDNYRNKEYWDLVFKFELTHFRKI
jgi:hypothetical protein